MENYIVFDIETTGLRPQESRITCICAKDSSGKKLEVCGANDILPHHK